MQAMPRFSEDSRQALHLAIGSLAVLLRFAAWWEAAVLVGMVLTCNLYVMRRFSHPSVYRDTERRRRFLSGVALHPFAILLLLFLLPDRLDIVAAAWGVLAFGDSMATLVGVHVPTWRIPWNRTKSVGGSAAFVLCGGAAGVGLCWWCRPAIIPPPYLWFAIAGPILAVLAAAAVETIPIRLDDSVSVAGTAAAVLWWVSLVSEDALGSFARASLPMLPVALGVNGAAAAAGYAMKGMSRSGAVLGTVTGTAILLATGWGGWSLLVATFVMAVGTSRLGLRRKTRLGIAEGRGGRRAAGSVVANTGVAAAAAVLSAVSYAQGPALIGFVAALAAGGSDTMASETGKAWGRKVVLFPSLRRVAPGTPGGISIIGTAAGLAGAAGLGAIGAATGLVEWGSVLPVIAGATAGAFTESALASRLEASGIVNNDVQLPQHRGRRGRRGVDCEVHLSGGERLTSGEHKAKLREWPTSRSSSIWASAHRRPGRSPCACAPREPTRRWTNPSVGQTRPGIRRSPAAPR